MACDPMGLHGIQDDGMWWCVWTGIPWYGMIVYTMVCRSGLWREIVWFVVGKCGMLQDILWYVVVKYTRV